jgi:hypothetical protein
VWAQRRRREQRGGCVRTCPIAVPAHPIARAGGGRRVLRAARATGLSRQLWSSIWLVVDGVVGSRQSPGIAVPGRRPRILTPAPMTHAACASPNPPPTPPCLQKQKAQKKRREKGILHTDRDSTAWADAQLTLGYPQQRLAGGQHLISSSVALRSTGGALADSVSLRAALAWPRRGLSTLCCSGSMASHLSPPRAAMPSIAVSSRFRSTSAADLMAGERTARLTMGC